MPPAPRRSIISYAPKRVPGTSDEDEPKVSDSLMYLSSTLHSRGLCQTTGSTSLSHGRFWRGVARCGGSKLANRIINRGQNDGRSKCAAAAEGAVPARTRELARDADGARPRNRRADLLLD